MRPGGRVLALAFVLCLLSGSVSANYHFVHYASRTGPFVPIYEKFDLDALPNGTLYYFVSEGGPESLAAGDSFASVLSEIRMAAKTWSGVPTSRLRLGFGGLSDPATPQSSPGIDVVFDELPPGLIAMGGPTTRADAAQAGEETFVPIIRSILVLQKDLSQRPSYSDAFFMTAVHELGHALGLQHTMTSSVMSTQVTRATTKSKPLAVDDIAGISLLYPAADFASQTGGISGRVTLDGQGVHLASVAAISPSGIAVSALTDPDGYYHIAGLLPGQYYLYAHPLPPSVQPELGPADVVLPVDSEGYRFPAGPVFRTLFYPGAKEILQAQVISISAGSVAEGFDFAVEGRGALQLYGVTTYSFPANYAVKPAFLNVYGPRNFLVASGVGLTANNAPTPGLRAAVVGGSAFVTDDGVRAYAPAPSFLEIDFLFNPFSGDGPRHLIFSLDDDIYVLPAGLNLVRRQPPSISTVAPVFAEDGRSLANVTGSGLSSSTRILFDGLPAAVAGFDEANQSMLVVPPQGASGHQAVVTALNSDGQGSMFLDAYAPPSFTYDPSEPPLAAVTPSGLPAGSEAMIEVTGVNTHFADGQTVIGFGTSDIAVRRLWVLSPTHLLANIHIAPSAPLAFAGLTVVTGFETISTPSAFQIQAANPQALLANPRLVNPVTGQPSIYAGGPAAVAVENLPEEASGINVTLNDYPAAVLSAGQGQITFAVPSELGLGPAVLRLQVGAQTVPPIVVQIDPAPPVILSVLSASGIAIDQNLPAAPGDRLTVAVAGLGEPGIIEDPARLRVTVAGMDHVPAKIHLSETDPNIYMVEFSLSSSVPAGTLVPLTVSIDHLISAPFYIPIAAPAAVQP